MFSQSQLNRMGFNPFLNQLTRQPYMDTLDLRTINPTEVLGTLADLGMMRNKRGNYVFEWSQPSHGIYTFSEEEHDLLEALPNGKHLLDLFTLGGGLHTTKNKLEEELIALHEAMLTEKGRRATTRKKERNANAKLEKLRAELEAKARADARADAEAKLRAEFNDAEAKLRAEFEAKARVDAEAPTPKATSNGPTGKQKIPAALKKLVWNKHVGGHVGEAKCLCCRTTTISQVSFHCGHVVAEKNGGKLELPNLRPICQNCNSSMGTKNMDEFIDLYKLHD